MYRLKIQMCVRRYFLIKTKNEKEKEEKQKKIKQVQMQFEKKFSKTNLFFKNI